MSSAVFPTLPGVSVNVEFAPAWKTTVHTSVSGKEQRMAWQSSNRKTYKVRFEALRDNVAAPSPYQTMKETEVVLNFLDTHKGAWDSFLFVDPYSKSQVRCRFLDDSITFTQIVPGMWQAEMTLIQVL